MERSEDPDAAALLKTPLPVVFFISFLFSLMVKEQRAHRKHSCVTVCNYGQPQKVLLQNLQEPLISF